jgi:hypothetical protein
MPRQPLNLKGFDALAPHVGNVSIVRRVLDGISFGFDTMFEGDTRVFTDHSLPLPKDEQDMLRVKMEENAREGRGRGPFSVVPFKNAIINRVFFIPKHKWHPEDGEVRLVNHGTFPGDGSSINEQTPRHDSGMPYYTISAMVSKVARAGRGALIFLVDVKSAYKKIIFKQKCWHQQVIKVNEDEFWIDVSGLFGTVTAGDNWNTVAMFAVMGARRKFGIWTFSVYVDNFDNVTPPLSPGRPARAKALKESKLLMELLVSLFGEDQLHELVWPTTKAQNLGWILDTMDMVVELPKPKRVLFLEQVRLLLHAPSFSISKLRSVIGLAHHIEFALPCMRVLVQHAMDVKRTCEAKAVFVVAKTHRLTATLKLLEYFLMVWSGRSRIYDQEWESGVTRVVWADSCCTKDSPRWGRGAFCEETREYYAEPWDETSIVEATRAVTESSSYLELKNKVSAVMTFAKPGDRILVKGDCKPMIEILQSMYTTNRPNLALLRALAVWCALNSVLVRFEFVAGKLNAVADALSRGKFQVFKSLVPSAVPSSRKTPHGVTPLLL